MSELDARVVGETLRTRTYGRSLDVRARTGSTNDDAREAATRGAPRGHVVVADAQDRGRGARGRTWSSPAGTDLYVSIVERTALPPAALAGLTLAVGLGAARAVDRMLAGRGLDACARIKWPNDVWLGGRKVAGVLVESSSVGARVDAVVLGIGLDVNRLAWEPSLDKSATSLLACARAEREVTVPFDRNVTLAALLDEVERAVDALAETGLSGLCDALTPRLALASERVRVGDVVGALAGLDTDGALLVRGAQGMHRVHAGTLRRAPDVGLRRWQTSDLDALAALFGDDATMAALGGALPRDEHAGLLARYVAAGPADPVLQAVYAATLDDAVVGSGRLATVANDADALELGFVVHASARGRGVGSELAAGLVERACELGAQRVVAFAASDHIASHRVLERAGLALTGRRDDGALCFARACTRDATR